MVQEVPRLVTKGRTYPSLATLHVLSNVSHSLVAPQSEMTSTNLVPIEPMASSVANLEDR